MLRKAEGLGRGQGKKKGGRFRGGLRGVSTDQTFAGVFATCLASGCAEKKHTNPRPEVAQQL